MSYKRVSQDHVTGLSENESTREHAGTCQKCCAHTVCGYGVCYCCTRAALDDFMQQRMKSWEPVLSPRKILFILFVITAIFFAVGITMTVANNNIIECKTTYATQEGSTDLVIKIDASQCNDSSITEISGDVYLFYELTNFYQNHRRYLKSRSDSQLQGKVYTNDSNLVVACDPRVRASDGRILHPCGLNAASVFSDEYSVYADAELTKEIALDESRETLCWKNELGSTFTNPSDEDMEAAKDKVDFWLYSEYYRKVLHMEKPGVGVGVENSHFNVWMREAALPTFRKLYAQIVPTPLQLPFYIKVSNNTFDLSVFNGTKSIVIAQSSWMGTKNGFLGTAYLVVASLFLILFLVLLYFHNRYPRRLGDVSWLRKALYANM